MVRKSSRNSTRCMWPPYTSSSSVAFLLTAPEIRLRITRFEGKRLSAPAMPRDDLIRLMMPSASARSMMVKLPPIPMWPPYWRSRMLAVAWNVPPMPRLQAVPVSRAARQSMFCAARRGKVSSKMDSGGAPCATRWAMRCTRVLVLPLPAPAMTRSGPSPWVTAARWAGFRTARMSAFSVWIRSSLCMANSLPRRAVSGNACDFVPV